MNLNLLKQALFVTLKNNADDFYAATELRKSLHRQGVEASIGRIKQALARLHARHLVRREMARKWRKSTIEGREWTYYNDWPAVQKQKRIERALKFKAEKKD